MMKVIIKKELKGFLKNPIYYVGILLIVFGLFQILQPYLKLHYWESDGQVASARLKNIADADIMNGYLPATEEEQIELALPDICRSHLKSMGRLNGCILFLPRPVLRHVMLPHPEVSQSRLLKIVHAFPLI